MLCAPLNTKKCACIIQKAIKPISLAYCFKIRQFYGDQMELISIKLQHFTLVFIREIILFILFLSEMVKFDSCIWELQ